MTVLQRNLEINKLTLSYAGKRFTDKTSNVIIPLKNLDRMEPFEWRKLKIFYKLY